MAREQAILPANLRQTADRAAGLGDELIDQAGVGQIAQDRPADFWANKKCGDLAYPRVTIRHGCRTTAAP